MQEKFKTSQLTFIIISFISSSALQIMSFVDGIAKQDSWVPVIAGFVISTPFLLVYVWLAKRFAGKNLFEINSIVFGKIIGYLISILYFFFFIMLLSFNLSDISGFYAGNIMIETPKMVFIVVTAIAGAFAVKRGIAAIAKASILTSVFTAAVVALTFFLLIGNMDFSNFLPLFEQPLGTYARATHIMICLPYLEIVVLLMLTPQLKNDIHLKRSMVGGGAISAFILLVVIIRDTSVLGSATSIYSNNAYQAVRMINIGDFLTRIELLVALSYTGAVFIKVCVLYDAAIKSLSYLIKVQDYGPLIVPFGSIVVILAMTVFPSTSDLAQYGTQYAPVFAALLTVIFPTLTFIIAKIRKFPENRKSGNEQNRSVL